MTITLESVKEEQAKLGAQQIRLAEMIARIEEDMKKPSYFEYQGKRIALNHGERYVGTIIAADPAHSRHIVLMPGEVESTNWKDAMEWADSSGGELPDRVEGALLFAFMKDEFKDAYYWTREKHASDSDYAWCQLFGHGSQDYGDTYDELRARLVRRLEIQ